MGSHPHPSLGGTVEVNHGIMWCYGIIGLYGMDSKYAIIPGEQLIELTSPTSQRDVQLQLQQEEEDLRLIEEQEASIRQLEV